jgi:hypothetical protein
MRGNVFMPLARAWKWPIPAALAVTGILSGLWHGLGWTFVIWGLVQTAILLALHYRFEWRRRAGRTGLPAPLAIGVTFLVTCLLGALFRAPDLAAAQTIYGSLVGFREAALLPVSPGLSLRPLALMVLAAVLIWVAPDFGQLFRGHWQFTELRSGVRPPPKHWAERIVAFRPSVPWGIVTGCALAAAVVALAIQGEANRFIYVQF